MKLVTAAVAALLVLVGCGGDDDDEANTEVETVVVPELVGMTLPEAKGAAEGASLEVEASDASSDDRMILSEGNWTVASQQPEAGSEVDSGTVVEVSVTNERDADSDFDGDAYADEIEQHFTLNLGRNEIGDACDLSDPRWHCYYEDLTGTSSDFRVDMHLAFPGDISEDEQRELAEEARLHFFNFVGEEFPELDTIVSYNSDGLDIGTTRRNEVPLLNRD